MGLLLHVKREGNKVCVNFSTGLPHEDENVTTLIDFSRRCEAVYAAELLARHIREELNEAIEKALRESYNDGWSDAKSHKAKRKHFASWLDRA